MVAQSLASLACLIQILAKGLPDVACQSRIGLVTGRMLSPK